MFSDLIFDFFGTLVDPNPYFFAPGENRAYTYLLAQGVSLAEDVFQAEYFGAFQYLDDLARQDLSEFPMDAVSRRFFQQIGIPSPDETIVAGLTCQFMAGWNGGMRFFPGIQAFITDLAARYRLSIISNTHYAPAVPGALQAMGIASYFAQVITSVELGIRKPNPRIFETALQGLGITSAQALFVGDNYVDDYQGACSAGIPACLIDARRAHVDKPICRIDSLFNLLSILNPN